MRQAFILSILFIIAATSCRRDRFFEGKAELTFSTDTVFFDTIFTTIGSITERLKVYNPYDKTVHIDRLYLKEGQASHFKLNVDGIAGKEVNDIDLEPFDSLYVFIEVTVDPNGGNTPMVLEEELIVQTSENSQATTLVAWGQDAYFYPSLAFGDQNGDGIGDVWELPTDKPIVFYGYSIVDTGAVLRIPCGARVHFHANSGLIVGHEASLRIEGCADNLVVIQGDRLEDYFADIPGQWGQIYGGIYLTQTSVDNVIEHAIIKNGTVGVIADSNTNENPTLRIENTQILNMSLYGILGQDSRIVGQNVVVANCGDHAVALRFGGRYEFIHCTFANFWSSNPRSKSTLLLNNHFKVDGKVYVRDLEARFTNTIVYGAIDEEVDLDEDDTQPFDYYFDHCVLKRDTDALVDSEHYSAIVLNPAAPIIDGVSLHPLFEDYSIDYRLHEWSRARDKGALITAIPTDIEGVERADGAPDIGAYEYTP
jgi:hypothetical protein